MDAGELEKIVAILEKSAVSELELEHEGTKLRITRAIGTHLRPAVAAEPAFEAVHPAVSEASLVSEEGLVRIESPIVGNYYSRPSPEAEPFVQVGARVKKGDTLCIVEAMKLMNEIEATVGGIIEKIFLSDGEVVEYGEVLFLIRPE